MAEAKKLPSSIPYIMGNEMAERFSYYGMKAFLAIYMSHYLMNAQGQPDYMDEKETKVWFHLFVSANYLFPIAGALLADIFWGKYKTIFWLSIVYCMGHLALAVDDTRLGLGIGLTLIAIGSGGIKPCVSANVGDQFDESNKELIPRVFNIFYLSINFGSLISTIFTPLLLKYYGPQVAFGVPGALMLIATIIFWLGRKTYVVSPPSGWEYFKKHVMNAEGWRAIKSLLPIYFFMAIFWSLYEQTGSSWVLQADNPHMDKSFTLAGHTFNIDPSQIQALNPLFVLLLVPFFAAVVYPFINRFFELKALHKVAAGFFTTVLTFAIMVYVETQLQAGNNVSVLWQALAYFILTASEVLVYGTGLEFSYTQAPLTLKSVVMGFFLLAISVGSLFTALLNLMLQSPDFPIKLEGADYYWFFTILMAVASLLFLFVIGRYKEQTYIRQ